MDSNLNLYSHMEFFHEYKRERGGERFPADEILNYVNQFSCGASESLASFGILISNSESFLT